MNLGYLLLYVFFIAAVLCFFSTFRTVYRAIKFQEIKVRGGLYRRSKEPFSYWGQIVMELGLTVFAIFGFIKMVLNFYS